MPYQPPSLATIVRRVVSRIVARSTLTDLHVGSELAQMVKAFSVEMRSLYRTIGRLRDGRVLDRAVELGLEDDVEEIGAEVLPDGLERGIGSRATAWGYLTRDGSVGDLAIPAGYTVARRDGVAYRLPSGTTILGGDTDSDIVQVICASVGTSGNAAVGAITRVVSSNPAGLRFTQTTQATGGLDQEKLEDFADRIRRHTRTLSRCNRPSILDRVLSAETAAGQKILFAKPLPDLEPGVWHVYVDDGTGTLSNAWATAASEILTASAAGGEQEFYLRHRGVRTAPVVAKNGAPLTSGTDYTFQRSTGQIRLATPLDATDEVEAEQYTYWTGLVAEAIRLVHGDPTDLVNAPPFVGMGVEVLIEGASSEAPSITGTAEFVEGADWQTEVAKVVTRIVDFTNRRNIGEPVVASQIVADAHRGVPTLRKLVLEFEEIYPSASGVAIRATSDDVTLT